MPKVADFSRLDKRFRLPDGVWEKLPGYKNHGFAVCKLQPGKQNVHIHDGEVHDTAGFDHVLYFQTAGEDYSRKPRWSASAVPAGMFMQIKNSQGLLDPDLH